MTEEEKKVQKKVTTPKTIKFEKDPSITETYTRSAFVNDDGTPNDDAVARFNADIRDPYAKTMGIDPNTGKFDEKRVGFLLGFDPAQYQIEQEKKQRLENFRKKEAGWRNALGVIGDIVTAAHGGNVYERKPDTVAKDAAKAEQDAKDNILKIGNSVPQAIMGQELKYLEGLRKLRDDYNKQFGAKVSRTIGGGTTRTTTGGTSTTTTVDPIAETKAKTAAAKASLDPKNAKYVRVNYTDENGTLSKRDIPIAKGIYDNWVETLKKKYNELISEKDSNGLLTERAKKIKNDLAKAKIYDKKSKKIDESAILSQGVFYNLTEDEVRKLKEDLNLDFEYNNGAWYVSGYKPVKNGFNPDSKATTQSPLGGM